MCMGMVVGADECMSAYGVLCMVVLFSDSILTTFFIFYFNLTTLFT